MRFLPVVLVCAITMTSSFALAQTPENISSALESPARAEQKQDDERRNVAEVLAFSGVKEGSVVVDFIPGGGYWTNIFTHLVGDAGHVYAIWPASSAKYAEKPLPILKAKNYPNVTVELQESDIISIPAQADVFWTVQNYHDVANDGGAEALLAFDKSVFEMLKPGGIYVIIDHADKAGNGLASTDTTHRISPDAVKAGVENAGFTFIDESDALHNPDDDYSLNVFDDAIRGKTDQFIYKFQKPLE